MNPTSPFETALQLLAMAYVASLMLLLVASNVCLAVIETIEEAGLSWEKSAEASIHGDVVEL